MNSVHPTGVATQMVVNEQFMQYAMEHPEFGETMQNLLPNVPVIEASDITEAMVSTCAARPAATSPASPTRSTPVSS